MHVFILCEFIILWLCMLTLIEVHSFGILIDLFHGMKMNVRKVFFLVVMGCRVTDY